MDCPALGFAMEFSILSPNMSRDIRDMIAEHRINVAARLSIYPFTLIYAFILQ